MSIVRESAAAVDSSRRTLVLVASGGAVGSVLRYGIAELLSRTWNPLPWETLIVNFLGCFAMGMLAFLVLRDAERRTWLEPFVAVGVLGGFTTFSAFSVQLITQLLAGEAVLALLYLVLNIGGSLLAIVLALLLADKTSAEGEAA